MHLFNVLIVAALVTFSAPAQTTPTRDTPAQRSQREQQLRAAIDANPNDVEIRFELASILEGFERYADAEAALLAAKLQHPDNRTVYLQLAGFYHRRGNVDAAITVLKERADRSPADAEAHYVVASYYWDEAYRNTSLTPEKKAERVAAGLDYVNRALAIDPEFLEAVVYKGLLLRLKAMAETDPARQQALIAEATELQDRAKALMASRSAAGTKSGGKSAASSATASAPPPPPPPPPPPGMAPVRVGGNIRPPAKLVDVAPDYPAIAQSARVQGIVIIEATIDVNGNVSDAKILKSIPLLDQAAIDAVRQWRFEVTRLNDIPVPVIMTTTVNFTLK